MKELVRQQVDKICVGIRTDVYVQKTAYKLLECLNNTDGQFLYHYKPSTMACIIVCIAGMLCYKHVSIQILRDFSDNELRSVVRRMPEVFEQLMKKDSRKEIINLNVLKERIRKERTYEEV